MTSSLVLERSIPGDARSRASREASTHETEFIGAFDAHADALFRHACFRISNRERALDLTQETFIKAWEYLRGSGEIRHWKSFLYRILNNLIIDEYRRKKEQSLDALFADDPVHAEESIAVDGRTETEDRLDEELLLAQMRSLILALPERHRTVLTLRYIDGFSLGEIAQTLGTSENVISVRIHRATERLKKLCNQLNTL